VTGVQTCALPIWLVAHLPAPHRQHGHGDRRRCARGHSRPVPGFPGCTPDPGGSASGLRAEVPAAAGGTPGRRRRPHVRGRRRGWIGHDSPLPEPAGHLVAAGNGIRAAKRGRPYRRSASAPRRPGETRAARRERATEDRCRGHGAGSAEGGGGYPAACPLHHCRNQHPQAAPEQLPLRRSRRIPDVARFPSVRRPPGYPDRGDAPGRIDHGCGIHQRIEMVKKRVRQWLDACPAWLRLQVFSNYVRLTGRPVDVDLLRGIAVELERQGRTRALERAWALISTLDPPTPGGLDYRLTLAAHAGRVAEVRWLLARLRQEVGLPPGRLLWLAGTLAAAGHPREARTILASVQGGAEGIRRLLRQSPSIVSGHLPADLDALLDSLQAGGSDQALLQLARMCFTVRRLDAACRL